MIIVGKECGWRRKTLRFLGSKQKSVKKESNLPREEERNKINANLTNPQRLTKRPVTHFAARGGNRMALPNLLNFVEALRERAKCAPSHFAGVLCVMCQKTIFKPDNFGEYSRNRDGK